MILLSAVQFVMVCSPDLHGLYKTSVLLLYNNTQQNASDFTVLLARHVLYASRLTFYLLKPVISLMTSPAMISPATDGTNAFEPGVLLREPLSSHRPLIGVSASSFE